MTKSWPTNSADLRAMARIAEAKQAARDLCKPRQWEEWRAHAREQLSGVLKDMASCGLTYEDEVNNAMEAPDGCTEIDDLADYTWIIQKEARLKKYADWITIVPTIEGPLRQRFVLSTGRVAILEEEKEEAELEERNEIEDQGQPELRR